MWFCLLLLILFLLIYHRLLLLVLLLLLLLFMLNRGFYLLKLVMYVVDGLRSCGIVLSLPSLLLLSWFNLLAVLLLLLFDFSLTEFPMRLIVLLLAPLTLLIVIVVLVALLLLMLLLILNYDFVWLFRLIAFRVINSVRFFDLLIDDWG